MKLLKDLPFQWIQLQNVGLDGCRYAMHPECLVDVLDKMPENVKLGNTSDILLSLNIVQ